MLLPALFCGKVSAHVTQCEMPLMGEGDTFRFAVGDNLLKGTCQIIYCTCIYIHIYIYIYTQEWPIYN